MSAFFSSKLMAYAAMSAAGALMFVTTARAGEILYLANDSSASADITFTPDGPNTDVSIVLTNLTPADSTTGAANLLTGVDIEFAPPATLSITSQSAAQEVTLAGTTPTNATLLSAGPYDPGWQVTDMSPDDKLWFVGFGAGGIPIIGPYDSNKQYVNGKSSLMSGPHPTEIYQTATYNLTAAGSFDTSNITGLTFLFNTSANILVPGTPDEGGGGRTPEPASLGLLSVGSLVLLRRRRSR